jgi:GGDEF domain-containing protein
MTSVLTAAGADITAAADLDAALLPGPTALHHRLADRLADPAAQPGCLVVVGLLRKDTGWPLAAQSLTTITALLAGALRGDDWLAREDHTEFGVLVDGDATEGDVVAARLTGVVSGAVTGVHASAGVVTLEAGLTAHEVERRALLCLDAARHRGPQAVVHYAGSR